MSHPKKKKATRLRRPEDGEVERRLHDQVEKKMKKGSKRDKDLARDIADFVKRIRKSDTPMLSTTLGKQWKKAAVAGRTEGWHCYPTKALTIARFVTAANLNDLTFRDLRRYRPDLLDFAAPEPPVPDFEEDIGRQYKLGEMGSADSEGEEEEEQEEEEEEEEDEQGSGGQAGAPSLRGRRAHQHPNLPVHMAPDRNANWANADEEETRRSIEDLRRTVSVIHTRLQILEAGQRAPVVHRGAQTEERFPVPPFEGQLLQIKAELDQFRDLFDEHAARAEEFRELFDEHVSRAALTEKAVAEIIRERQATQSSTARKSRTRPEEPEQEVPRMKTRAAGRVAQPPEENQKEPAIGRGLRNILDRIGE